MSVDYRLIDELLEKNDRLPVHKIFYHYPGASSEEIYELIRLKKLVVKDGYIQRGTKLV